MARTFNGTSDNIRADAAVAANASNFTVALWMKSTSTASTNIYGEGNGSTANPFFTFTNTSTGVIMNMRNDSGSTVFTSATITGVHDGKWHHLVYAQAGLNYATYLDGSVFQSTAHGNPGSLTLNRLTFGAQTRTSTTGFWAGTLAEIASWQRQLSAKEVLSLASGLPASHLGPTHYWPLWGKDSPEPDIGNG